MARIKVLEYTFENETIKIPVNVSVNGVFSCSIPHLMAQKLGLEKNDLLGSKLSDVEDVLNSAFYEYKQRSNKTRMMVAISFKATRNFMMDEKGNPHPAFDMFFDSSRWADEYYDRISFGYRILLEESINGTRFYYDARQREQVSSTILENKIIPESRQCEGWVGIHSTTISSTEKIIMPYSEKLVENLESIKQQLRNASNFLSELLSASNREELLVSDNFKLLK